MSQEPESVKSGIWCLDAQERFLQRGMFSGCPGSFFGQGKNVFGCPGSFLGQGERCLDAQHRFLDVGSVLWLSRIVFWTGVWMPWSRSLSIHEPGAWGVCQLMSLEPGSLSIHEPGAWGVCQLMSFESWESVNPCA